MTEVVLAGRQAGKTTRVVEWLLQGEKTAAWPGWSRVILSASLRAKEQMIDDYHWADLMLRDELDFPQGLEALLLGPEDLKHADRWRAEVAVDNLDVLLQSQLGFRPALVSLTGEIYRPAPTGGAHA